jgi:hypothetical protein
MPDILSMLSGTKGPALVESETLLANQFAVLQQLRSQRFEVFRTQRAFLTRLPRFGVFWVALVLHAEPPTAQ